MITVGFLGPQGTFSQEAMELYYKDSIYKALPFNSIPDLLYAVEKNGIDQAIVPIESSIEGAVNATLDMLAWEVNLFIQDEFVLEVRQNLIGKKGTKIEDIKYLVSHPQPIGQCRQFISQYLSKAEVKLVNSTALAVKEVSEPDCNAAAIGSVSAAKFYGLEVIKSDIHDRANNHTRFAIVGQKDNLRTGRDKTSLVFSTEDRPGSLYRILDIFNLWDINMSRIESRPSKEKLGRYIFFIDIYGHREDPDIADALKMVKRKTSFYKFLGSYPAARH